MNFQNTFFYKEATLKHNEHQNSFQNNELTWVSCLNQTLWKITQWWPLLQIYFSRRRNIEDKKKTFSRRMKTLRREPKTFSRKILSRHSTCIQYPWKNSVSFLYIGRTFEASLWSLGWKWGFVPRNLFMLS